MELYLLRHGVTAYNAEKRYQGWRDIPLSPEGKAMLQTADFCPEKVYISPLFRAKQTAEILFPQAELIVEEKLKEMNFGKFEGKSIVELKDDADYRAWIESGGETDIPGGENKEQFGRRAGEALTSLIDQAFRNHEERLVILAHGGTQMAVMERFALPQKPFFSWCGQNGGGYLCRVERSQWEEERKFTLCSEVCYSKTDL